MSSTHPAGHRHPAPIGRLLSIAEVADALGVDIRHVRRLVHERRIPYIKWGHLLRFDPTDIEAWVDTYRRYPGNGRNLTPGVVNPRA